MIFKGIRRWFRRPRVSAGNVYYVKLCFSGEVFYKIGFTTKFNINDRFAYSGHGDERHVASEFFFTYREDAWDVEQSLLEHFEKYRAFGKYSNNPSMPLAGRGQSELFRQDVLGLDEDLYVIYGILVTELTKESENAKDGCLMMLVGLALAPFTLGFSLFFLFGGASGFFHPATNRAQAPLRPIHSKGIKELIDALSQKEHAA